MAGSGEMQESIFLSELEEEQEKSPNRFFQLACSSFHTTVQVFSELRVTANRPCCRNAGIVTGDLEREKGFRKCISLN